MEKINFLKLKPMLLSEKSDIFNDDNYIFELKFDGIRAMILVKNSEIIIKSKNGIILNDIFPELQEIVNITKDVCIFDGEIILLENGKPSFSKVMERFKFKDKLKINRLKNESPVVFICFDIIYKNVDITKYSLLKRKEILNEFNDTDFFIKAKYFINKGNELFNFVKNNDLEGVVAKKTDSKYYFGFRTNEWIKIKNYKTEEFFVCGYVFTKNKVLNVLLGEYVDGNYYYVGSAVMGEKSKIYNMLIKSLNVKNYLKNYNKVANFIPPKYKLLVNYIERTKRNMLRETFIKE